MRHLIHIGLMVMLAPGLAMAAAEVEIGGSATKDTPIAGGNPLAVPGFESFSASSVYLTPAAMASASDAMALQKFNSRTAGLQRIPDPDGKFEASDTESAARWAVLAKVFTWKARIARHSPPAAGRLMPKLKEIFASEGVPSELAWIAEVESRLNPDAESPAGARGLFQFMPATAERFGILTETTDLRTETESSARAAARYLSILHKQFGNWRLALAAYNAGEGRVRRLLEKHNARTFEEIADHLPSETRLYVPKVMATLLVRENVRLGGLPGPTFSPTLN